MIGSVGQISIMIQEISQHPKKLHWYKNVNAYIVQISLLMNYHSMPQHKQILCFMDFSWDKYVAS